MSETDEIDDQLKQYGSLPDDEIPLWDVALLLSMRAHPNLHTDRYQQHIKTLIESTETRFKKLITADANDDASTRLAALKHVIADEHGY